MAKNIVVIVGPPGSGKSTLARAMAATMGYAYINQDTQGGDHVAIFLETIRDGRPVVIDRMNFDRAQRERYLGPAKKAGYATRIIVLHVPIAECKRRCEQRKDHPTIKDSKTASRALGTFFGKYQRPTTNEADFIEFRYPDGNRPSAIICDLDGTLCDVEHRRHHVRAPEGYGILNHFDVVNPVTGEGAPQPFKKNWAGFFADIPKDTPNEWCVSLLEGIQKNHKIVFCSGRSDGHMKVTKDWLDLHVSHRVNLADTELYMRQRNDSRQDSIVKEIILDFEILTRFTPLFAIDDRQQVVDMWRSRGIPTLQCDVGDF